MRGHGGALMNFINSHPNGLLITAVLESKTCKKFVSGKFRHVEHFKLEIKKKHKGFKIIRFIQTKVL